MGKQRSKEGFIYIISDPNLVKIGESTIANDIKSRLRTYQTSSPHRDYLIEYYIQHPDCYGAEQKIKEMMRHFALEIRNEWFKIDLNIAKTRLDETLDPEEKFPIDIYKK